MKIRGDKGEIFSCELPIPEKCRKKVMKSKPVNAKGGIGKREKK